MTILNEMRKEDSKRREAELINQKAELQEHQQNVAATYFEHTLSQVITFLRNRGLLKQGLEFRIDDGVLHTLHDAEDSDDQHEEFYPPSQGQPGSGKENGNNSNSRSRASPCTDYLQRLLCSW